MATIKRLSHAQSIMNMGSPGEIVEEPHHAKPVKVELLNNAALIKADELTQLIKKLTLDNNEEILRILDESKGPYLFTSDDLSKMLEVTTSIKTKINIIGLVGPRLVDPKSKTAFFTGLFRYAEEKSAVEEILKARTHALSAQQFSNTGLKHNLSSRNVGGRGSPLTGGRGGGAGRGNPGSRAGSNSSLVSEASSKKEHLTPVSVARILSDEHDHDLVTTHAGFDDVLSALDDLAHKNGTSKNNSSSSSHHHTNGIVLEKKRLNTDVSLCPIVEADTDSPNSSTYSLVDPGRTTNDSSSIDSANASPENKKVTPHKKEKKGGLTTEDHKVILNKIDSCNTILTQQPEAPAIQIEERSSTTVKETDLSSISSESNNSRRSSSLRYKAQSYMGSFSSPPSAEKKKAVSDVALPSIKTITKKYSEAAIKSSSKDEHEVSHHEIIAVSSTTVAERTKAISNPLLLKKQQQQQQQQQSTPNSSSKYGKVQATYPFSPINSPLTPSALSPKSNDCPKVGKLNLIYPYSNNSPKSANNTPPTSSSSSSSVNKNNNNNNNHTKPPNGASKINGKVPVSTFGKSPAAPTTKVTNYISSSRSLASGSSDNDTIASEKTTKSLGSGPRSATPLVRLNTPPMTTLSEAVHQALKAQPTQPVAVVLSNYIPEKAAAGGSGNFNYDLATRCAVALNLTKEEFLVLEERGPIRVVGGIEKHAYAELVRRNFTKSYGVLQQTELEKYLAEEEFPLAFNKTEREFFAQVRWRQVECKKKALLF